MLILRLFVWEFRESNIQEVTTALSRPLSELVSGVFSETAGALLWRRIEPGYFCVLP